MRSLSWCPTARRRTSRNVALTAAFLALAAGGAAACDSSTSDEDDPLGDSYVADSGNYPGGGSGSSVVDSGGSEPDVSDPGDGSSDEEVFYCADENGEVVPADDCDNRSHRHSSYYLWHSPTYPRGLTPGSALDGGDSFPAGDQQARRAFRLPAAGKVGNGTVKTNVVGRQSTGSAGG